MEPVKPHRLHRSGDIRSLSMNPDNVSFPEQTLEIERSQHGSGGITGARVPPSLAHRIHKSLSAWSRFKETQDGLGIAIHSWAIVSPVVQVYDYRESRQGC